MDRQKITLNLDAITTRRLIDFCMADGVTVSEVLTDLIKCLVGTSSNEEATALIQEAICDVLAYDELPSDKPISFGMYTIRYGLDQLWHDAVSSDDQATMGAIHQDYISFVSARPHDTLPSLDDCIMDFDKYVITRRSKATQGDLG